MKKIQESLSVMHFLFLYIKSDTNKSDYIIRANVIIIDYNRCSLNLFGTITNLLVLLNPVSCMKTAVKVQYCNVL